MGRLTLPNDLSTFHGRRRLHLEAFSGTVMGHGQWTRLPAGRLDMASSDDISEGRFAILETRPEENGFRDFMLLDEQGRGLRMSFVDGPVPVNVGDRVTAVSCIRRERKRGQTVILVNHTTGKTFGDAPAREEFQRPILGWFLAAVAAMALVCLLPVATFRITYPRGEPPAELAQVPPHRVLSTTALMGRQMDQNFTQTVISSTLLGDAIFGATGNPSAALKAGPVAFTVLALPTLGLGGYLAWRRRRRADEFLRRLEHWVSQSVLQAAASAAVPVQGLEAQAD